MFRKEKIKECPSCAIEVRAIEAECPYCGYEFPTEPKGLNIMAWIFLILIVLWLIMSV